MKKNKFLLILFLLFLFICIEGVSAKCSYSFHYYISGDSISTGDAVGLAYSEGTIHDVEKIDGKWQGDSTSSMGVLGGNEEILDWNESYCPDYIGVIIDFTDRVWYGFSKETVTKKGASLLDLVDDDEMFVYVNETLDSNYTCEYESFDIIFDSEGYAIGTNSKLSNAATTFTYSLSEKMKTETVAKPGVCEDVHYCVTVASTSMSSYKIFADEIDYEINRDSCLEAPIIGRLFNETTDDHESGCRTYEDYIKSLQKKYTACKANLNDCGLYHTEKSKLENICNSITQYADYGVSDCLDKCLNLKDDIADRVEGKFEVTIDECNFSKRLIGIIGDIVKWVKYILPIVVIVLGILDFIKAIGSDKDDEMKKAQGKFIKRLISAALVFIVPLILEFILIKMGFDYNECGLFD